jgi:hypothetical protein
MNTAPIPLKVHEAQEVDMEDILGPDTNRVGAVRKLVGQTRVVAPIGVDPAGAFPQALGFTPLHIALLSLGPVAYLLLGIGMRVGHRLRRHAHTARRRRARVTALEALARAKASATKDPRAACAAVSAALRQYLADKLDVANAAITPADAVPLLEARGVATAVARRFQEILERNFNAGYGAEIGQDIDAAEESRKAGDAVAALESALGEDT